MILDIFIQCISLDYYISINHNQFTKIRRIKCGQCKLQYFVYEESYDPLTFTVMCFDIVINTCNMYNMSNFGEFYTFSVFVVVTLTGEDFPNKPKSLF